MLRGALGHIISAELALEKPAATSAVFTRGLATRRQGNNVYPLYACGRGRRHAELGRYVEMEYLRWNGAGHGMLARATPESDGTVVAVVGAPMISFTS